jgi:hypothetical protein
VSVDEQEKKNEKIPIENIGHKSESSIPEFKSKQDVLCIIRT